MCVRGRNKGSYLTVGIHAPSQTPPDVRPNDHESSSNRGGSHQIRFSTEIIASSIMPSSPPASSPKTTVDLIKTCPASSCQTDYVAPEGDFLSRKFPQVLTHKGYVPIAQIGPLFCRTSSCTNCPATIYHPLLYLEP